MAMQMKGTGMANAQQIKQYQQQRMNSANHGMMNNSQAAMLAAMQSGNAQLQNGTANGMPPPNSSQPKQLSSGHIPAINAIKHSLQAAHPQASQHQIDQMANEQMKRHFQTTQARQNAVNAVAGAYGNQFQQQNANGSTQQQYSQLMRQRLMQQQQQAQNGTSSVSPHLQQASPASMHLSPVMQQAVPNGTNRPPSRNTATPMARIPSSGSMPSPGLAQGSPRPQMVKQA